MADYNELAWAAGFYDGEGCITLHKSKHSGKNWKYPNIHIGQVDRRPLDRFLKAIGVGHIYGPYRHSKNTNAKERFDLFVRKQDEVLHVISSLWNFLSEPKKEQIKEVMSQWRQNG